MKKLQYISLVTTILVIGCTKDNDEKISVPNQVCFTINEIASTKANESFKDTLSQRINKIVPLQDSKLFLEIKELDLGADNQGFPLTKGTIMQDVAAFQTKYATSGFGLWAYNGGTLTLGSFSSGSKVTYQASLWQSADKLLWASGETMSFFAYAPYTTDSSEAITAVDANNGSPTISYTALSDISAQVDLTVAKNVGFAKPSDMTVPLTFTRPLTAIEFKLASDFPAGTIASISFKNVKTSGVYNISDTTWTSTSGSGDYTLTLNRAVTAADATANLNLTSGSNNVIFMVPQAFSDETATIELTYTPEGGSATTIFAPINATASEWKKGKKYVYILSPLAGSYNFEVAALPTLTYAGLNSEIEVTSCLQTAGGDTIKNNVPYTVEYSSDSLNWNTTAPAWLSITRNSSNGKASFHMGRADSIATSDGIFETTAKGTTSNYYNLSNSTGAATIENTANCYIINAPGYYKLPLVYGNAIKGGVDNRMAYGYQGNTQIDVIYVNSDNQCITNPHIRNSTMQGSGTLTAGIVWQDVENLVTVDGVEDNGDNSFLKFHVSNPTQGNAVVVARINGVVAWSWHIWVTGYKRDITGNGDFSATSRVDDGGDGLSYTFMPYNLGWCGTSLYYYTKRTYYVRLTQDESDLQKGMKISSPEYHPVDGNCTFYQHGRKDPFPGAIGSEQDKTTYPAKYSGSYHPGYIHPTETIPDTGWCIYEVRHSHTIVEAIQHPNCLFPNTERYQEDWLGVENKAQEQYKAMWHSGLNSYDDKATTPSGRHSKTIYDPCPVGYCVPNSHAFLGLTVAELPKLGMRNPTDGNADGGFLYDVGEIGWYWSSCAAFLVSHYTLNGGTYFNTDGTNVTGSVPANSHTYYYIGRSYAYAIRPVKED